MVARLGPCLLVLMLIAAACGGGSVGETSIVTDTPSSDAVASADDPAAEQGEDGPSETPETDADEPTMAASSPIGAFFAADGGLDEAIAEYSTRVEEEIVSCMASQGFEFARSSTRRQNLVQQRQNDLTIREWTTEYGFGISTSFDSLAQSRAADPNAAIVMSMGAAEREIWIETLTGGQGLAAAGGGLGAGPLEERGCIGQALIETGGGDAIEGLRSFGDVYDEGVEAILDERAMVGAVDAWSTCMNERGFAGHGALDGPEEEIRDRFNEVVQPMRSAMDALSPEQGQALISGESLNLADLPDLDLDALREVQADEIALALADLDCYDAEVKAIYEPLRDRFENQMLGEFAAEFDALRTIGS